jgi:hypothetical protein
MPFGTLRIAKPLPNIENGERLQKQRKTDNSETSQKLNLADSFALVSSLEL